MKLIFLYLSALTVGVLCKIDDACIVKSGEKGVRGTCQRKNDCMKAGLAAFSKSRFTDSSDSTQEIPCPDDDKEVQCCVEIKCGSNKCLNNVEGNPCAEGSYVPNFRDRTLCPSSSSEDNVQCCVENSHNALKRRQMEDYVYPQGQTFGGRFRSWGSSNLPEANIGSSNLPGGNPTLGSASDLGGTVGISAVDVGFNPDIPSSFESTPNVVQNSYTPPDLNLPAASAFEGQIETYSQDAIPNPNVPVANVPAEGASFQFSSSLRPELALTEGTTTFTLGPTVSVPGLVSTGLGGGDVFGALTSGFQAGVSSPFKKMKRWWS